MTDWAVILVPKWLVLVVMTGCIFSLIGSVIEMVQRHLLKKQRDRLSAQIERYMERRK